MGLCLSAWLFAQPLSDSDTHRGPGINTVQFIFIREHRELEEVLPLPLHPSQVRGRGQVPTGVAEVPLLLPVGRAGDIALPAGPPRFGLSVLLCGLQVSPRLTEGT